jgi:hypothetical protein
MMPSLDKLKAELEAALDDMASTLATIRREQSNPVCCHVSAEAVADYDRARVRWLMAMEALRSRGELLARSKMRLDKRQSAATVEM